MPPAVRIAIAGIALGTTVMILAIAIITGFKQEIKNKIIGFNAHIHINKLDNNTSYETQPITITNTLINQLNTIPNIKHTQTYATKPALLKTKTDNQGIILKGIPPNYNLNYINNNIKQGNTIQFNNTQTTNQALISQQLAQQLNLKINDQFIAYFLLDNIKARKFTITGIYQTGFEDYDKYYIITDIKHIQNINNWNNNQASGIEIQLHNYKQLNQTADDIANTIATQNNQEQEPLATQTIQELNPMIFSWLDVLDTNVLIILILMTTVAAFTMIAGLLVIILQHINMIGTLKALGQNNNQIKQIFLHLAIKLITKGTIIGNITAITLATIQQKLQPLKLDPATYYIDAVPIHLNTQTLIILNITTITITTIMMIAPTKIITNIQAAKTIRYQ